MDFDMGKYGFYVWGAYGLSALSLAALVLLSLRAHTQGKKALATLSASLEKSTPPTPAPAPETLEAPRKVASDAAKDVAQ